MKFLVGERGRDLLLHPIYDESRILEVWGRYQSMAEPAVFASIVWRIVEAGHVEAASKIVRSTPSYPLSTLEPDIPKETDNVRSNRYDSRDDRGRSLGDRGRGTLTRKPDVLVAPGRPWD